MNNHTSIYGTMLRLISNPAVVILAKQAGLDFIMLDMEHGPYSMETVSSFSTVAQSMNLHLFVRVPELARGLVSRALDCGATGIMVPMVETAQQASMFVEWTKYPPLGKRGMSSIGPHTGYTNHTDKNQMIMESNQRIWAIAQIETLEGCNNVDEIAATEGIDALLVGPNDLAVSLGMPEEFTHPTFEKSIDRIAVAAKKHGVVFGMHAGVGMMKKWLHYDLTFQMNSLDINIISDGLVNISKNICNLNQEGQYENTP